jgi:hypothetical protein
VSGTFVAKRFLQGVAGDLVNADYIVRLFVDGSGKLFAETAAGANIELQVREGASPAQSPELLLRMVSI